MNTFKKYVDPILLASFLLAGGTGILMMFHVRSHLINELHEWTGLFFVLSGVAHVILNLNPLWLQLRQKAALITLVIFVALLSAAAIHLAGETYERPTPHAPLEAD